MGNGVWIGLMTQIRSHHDLEVWRLAMDLADDVHGLVKRFPASEQFGLSSQLTRAVYSVPGNIAEGNARGTSKDYAHFLAIAKGSLMEAETYLLLAVRFGYLSQESASPTLELITRISKMLTSLRARLMQRA